MKFILRLPAALICSFLFLQIFALVSCNEAGGSANNADSLTEEQRHLPENALKSLETASGLKVTAMATEPLLKNPTNIDVDDRGRIWVTEAYNYRPDINGNPTNGKGDRILILEDKDGNGSAETAKVFYQGPEINAPLGVCVLGNRVLVSQSPYVWAFYDDNGDDSADRKEVIFQGIGGEQHDHGMHTFTFGPDGKLYFNFGNAGETLKDKNGKVVRDQDGDEIGPNKYKQGMVFRCDPDGSHVECLGNNFRNNYEVAVDSYGTMWQSDNDDDGNRGVRINYVMDYGNYGYTDEMTGAGWQAERTNMEDSIKFRHWHLNDPGVVPNLLQTGAGSPTGIVVYEGDLFPEQFRNQVIHADAGVNVVRAYPVKKSGAGFTANIVNVLNGEKDKWFRPADICVAPDGSLIVADWYDPGVGGHQAGDQQRGRIYRVAPGGSDYKIPEQDYNTPAGAVKALQNPNLSVRQHAWVALHNMGAKATSELERLWNAADADPRMRARAFWVLVNDDGGEKYIEDAVKSNVPEFRMMALRAAREKKSGVIAIVKRLVNDKDPQVRRECAIALRHLHDKDAPALWATLAAQHDGKDRWYLEALGIGADRQWDEFFTAYLAKIKEPLQTDAGRDIVWRARTDKAIPYLSHLASDNNAPLKSRLRYFRAFDFNTGRAKSKYLLQMLETNYGKDTAVTALVLHHLDPKTVLGSPVAKKALDELLLARANTQEFLDLVTRYDHAASKPQLLELILTQDDGSLTGQAATLLLKFKGRNLVDEVLRSNDKNKIDKVTNALGEAGSKESITILEQVALSDKYDLPTRQMAAKKMGYSMNGEDRVLALLEAKKIPEELIPSSVDGVKNAWRKAVYEKAKTYLPGQQAVAQQTAEPTINELAALTGNRENGKKVFSNTCSVCHQAEGTGQNFGPSLSQIGGKLPKEGLLDAILHPSAGISFGYETAEIDLKDGTKYTGIVASKTASEIQLKMPGGISKTLKSDEVKAVKASNESMMPVLWSSMSKQELADLLEYLEGLKKS
jgi:putative membrane-bound dehydrogenase-like protein